MAAGLLFVGPQAVGVAVADTGSPSAHSAGDARSTGGSKTSTARQSGRNAKPTNRNTSAATTRRATHGATRPSAAATNPATAAAHPPATVTLTQPAAASAPVTTTHVAALTVPVMNSAKGLLPSIAGFLSNVVAKLRALVEGAAVWVRRNFFDSAPTVDAVQTTGQLSGEISGNLNVHDAEGNKTTVTILQSAQHGTVELNPDGTYSYTPGSTFTGQDSFIIKVTDAGTNIDLSNPLRPAAVYVNVVVDQGTQIYPTFTFKYTTGAMFWTSEARAALEWSATQAASEIAVTTPTTITLSVIGRMGFDESGNAYSALASAYSPRVDGSSTGFYGTVVQQKILTGTDPNGNVADGRVMFNFIQPWGYGDSIVGKKFDFESVAMHELLHAMGWTKGIYAAGTNTGTNWSTYDQFITDSNGVAAVNATTYKFNTALNPNLTGRNGGLYFNGPNAVLAYGGPIPLYTPPSYRNGSSLSHTDDNTFNGKIKPRELMNARDPYGPGPRTFSAIDRGVLLDLGYTLASALVVTLPALAA